MRNVKTKKVKIYSLDDKCTEMFGNVQLGKYYTQDIATIREDFYKAFDDIKYIDYYFFIVHDDSDYLHVHFALQLSCQVRLSTMLNAIADKLKVDNLAISITHLESIVGSLKYFCHLTEESIEDGKKQYPSYLICSNCSQFVVDGYIDSESDNNLSVRAILQLVLDSDTKSDVLLRIGVPKLIAKNRYIIDNLWNDKGTLKLRQQRLEDNLPF